MTHVPSPSAGAPSVRRSDGRRGGRLARFATPAVLLLGVLIGSDVAGAQVPAAQAGGNPCMQCHEGIEDQAGSWNGRRFSHTPHLERARLDCTFCHAPLERHGQMRLTGVSDCNDCHHNRSSGTSCSVCHEGGVGAPERVIPHEVGDFDHGIHGGAGLACTTCHAGNTMSAASVECVACHMVHHRPESGCVACHRVGTTPAHPMDIHWTGCTTCHGESSEWIDHWTREVCSVCHTDRSDHYPERPCSVCHIVPPIPTSGGD